MGVTQVPRTVARAGVKRYGLFLKRYPMEVRQQRMQALSRWTWLQPIVDEVQAELYPPPPIVPINQPAIVDELSSLYLRYACQQGDPLQCTLCQPLTPEKLRIPYCSICSFPTLLPEKAELRGQRGNYQIERWLGRQGAGRLYTAIQLGSSRPVVIKEYLLPTLYVDATTARLQKALFQNLATLGLADGRIQDFRLLQPLDAIADDREERCYLVTDEPGAYPTLNQYLSQRPLTAPEVRWLLSQILQTLEFLHGQKFRLPSGLMQTGMAHGNLNLHTVLLGYAHEADNRLQPVISRQDIPVENSINQPVATATLPAAHPGSVQPLGTACFVYLCDMALWERPFNPKLANLSPPSIAQDLIDLGTVAFYAWAGKMRSLTGEALDPRNPQHWQTTDPNLKAFILRLMQIETPFDSAEAARRELAQLPQPVSATLDVILPITEIEPKPQFRWLLWLLGLLGLGLLGWLLWWLLSRPQSHPAIAPQLTTIKEVGSIPPGRFRYTAPRDGIWSYVWQQPNLIQRGQTLEQRLQRVQPRLQLNYQPVDSLEVAIDQVQSGKAAFAVLPLISPLPDDLTSIPIAYDGLAVVVAFSYANRENSLPAQLNGKVTLKQLQQLYQQQVANWQDLGGAPLSVNLYQPKNREAIDLFAQRVVQQKKTVQIDRQQFTRTLPEFEMFRAIIQDFEVRRAGGVGFSSLSKVVGQCSVYPLAIQTAGNPPVQAVVLDDNTAIDQNTDLCDRKGSYRPSVELVRSGRYPLAYPIAVVFPRRNDRPPIGEKFAEVFKTREGQTLLQQTGLVPLE